MTSYLFSLLMTKAIGISLLIMIILAFRPIVLRCLNAKVAYYLWAMIPIFILLPTTAIEQGVSSTVLTFFPGSRSTFPSISIGRFLMNTNFETSLLFVWLFGVALTFGVYIRSYKKLTRSFKPSSYRLPSQVNTERNSSKFKSILTVNSALVNAPAIFGFFNLFLILPPGFSALSKQNQLMILKHEFFHLARHDHLVNILRVLIKSLFWFNPLIYWGDKVLEADQEISVDLGVLENSSSEEKRNYAQALIDAVSGKQPHSFVSQWKYQSLIKLRIKMIKSTVQRRWHDWVGGCFALVVITAISFFAAAENTKVEKSEAMPMVTIAPRYPLEAAKAGVEGFVKLKLNIAIDGKPYDISVIASEPANVFDQEAIKAIQKWRFKPNLIKGELVENLNVFYTLEFKLTPEEDTDSETSKE